MQMRRGKQTPVQAERPPLHAVGEARLVIVARVIASRSSDRPFASNATRAVRARAGDVTGTNMAKAERTDIGAHVRQ